MTDIEKSRKIAARVLLNARSALLGVCGDEGACACVKCEIRTARNLCTEWLKSIEGKEVEGSAAE